MSDILKEYQKAVDDIKNLAEEMLRLSEGMETKSKANDKIQKQIDDKMSNKRKHVTSQKVLRPVTTLYKNKEDLKNAKENPEITSIMSAMNRILGG